MNSRVHELLAALESKSLSAQELAARLGVSQPTISRLLAEAGDRVLRLGVGRARRYALPRTLPAWGYRFPLYRVDEQGGVQAFGILEAYHGGYQVMLATGAILQFDDLPWFLQDMRLQGFLGRLFARNLANLDVEMPGRLDEWGGDQILAFLLRWAVDGPGDLLVGDGMRDQLMSFSRALAVDTRSNRSLKYPEMAELVLNGSQEMPSSAAGEQPKFVVLRYEDGVQCIVKFSPPLDTAVGQRWADLLHCEYLALTVLQYLEIAAATPSIYLINNRVYFEVPCFDRVGVHGRRGVVSLEAANSEFAGSPYADGWSGAGAALARGKKISETDAKLMARLEAFGRCIANTDMHFGNLAFFRSPMLELSLAPVYDMLPMYYAPVNSEVVRKPLPPLRLPPALAEYADWARSAAAEFWRRVVTDERISLDFREIAQQHVLLLS